MPSYDNIRLEKGLYNTSKGFTDSLEELDPSENYQGTALEGLDAFERQLKRFDIHVSGTSSDVVEKFFQTADSTALFPEYVSRAVKQGLDSANILPRICATTTKINGLDYRAISSTPKDDDKELKIVLEGSFIPQTVIKPNDKLVTLKKRGRMLVASYEALRFQRLDLFTVMLKQIGAYIAKSQLTDAINTLIYGCTELNTAETGKLTYSDLISLWDAFDPYELTTIIASGTDAKTMLNFAEFKDAAAGLNFHATGKLITPFGADLIKSDSAGSGLIVGLDKNCALEKIEAGSVTTDYDKLIDRQLERAAITCTAGFSRIFDDAVRTLAF